MKPIHYSSLLFTDSVHDLEIESPPLGHRGGKCIHTTGHSPKVHIPMLQFNYSVRLSNSLFNKRISYSSQIHILSRVRSFFWQFVNRFMSLLIKVQLCTHTSIIYCTWCSHLSTVVMTKCLCVNARSEMYSSLRSRESVLKYVQQWFVPPSQVSLQFTHVCAYLAGWTMYQFGVSISSV